MNKKNNYLLQKILLSAGITLFTASGCAKIEETKGQDEAAEKFQLETEIDRNEPLNDNVVEGTVAYHCGISDSANEKINENNQSREYQTGVSDEKIARMIATVDGKLDQSAYEKALLVLAVYQGEQFGNEKAYFDINNGISYSDPSQLLIEYQNQFANLETENKYSDLGNEFLKIYVESCENVKMKHSMGIAPESHTQEENINYLIEGFLQAETMDSNQRKHALYYTGNSLQQNAFYIASDIKSPIYQNALSHLSYKIGETYGLIAITDFTKEELINLEKINRIDNTQVVSDGSEMNLLIAKNFDKGYVSRYNSQLEIAMNHTNVK